MTHNVYLLLYPREFLKKLLAESPELEESIFQALQTISTSELISGGRVYGGGLHKLEPKELGQISAAALMKIVGQYPQVANQMSFDLAL